MKDKNIFGSYKILVLVLLGCIMLVLATYILPAIIVGKTGPCKDPNWDKTHLRVSGADTDEIIDLFGDGLLLDRMVLKDSYNYYYFDLVLSFEEDTPEDRNNWVRVDGSVYYDDINQTPNISSVARVDVYISLGKEAIDYRWEEKRERQIRTTFIEDIEIKYYDVPNEYTYLAEFEYNSDYYYMLFSARVPDILFRNTLRQMFEKEQDA